MYTNQIQSTDNTLFEPRICRPCSTTTTSIADDFYDADAITTITTTASRGLWSGEGAMTGNNFLQIDPNAHFNASAGHYDDLPENFLETVSPHNSGQPMSIQGQDGNGAHLASLNNMSVSVSDSFSYAMPNMSTIGVPTYSSALKAESLDHLITPRSSSHLNVDKYSYGNSASLLSPLQLDGRNDHSNLLGISRPNGRASEMLSSLRTNPSYLNIKEELTSDLGYNNDYDPTYLIQPQPSQQELERMTAATPPAISGDLMGQLQGNDPFQLVQFEVATSQAYHSIPQPVQPAPSSSRKRARTKAAQQAQQQQQMAAGPSSNDDGQVLAPGAGVPRAVYSTSDVTDPLNAEIDDDIYIDTRDLCKRIAYELKQHSIPQAIFAERILCRSQGTLSDLLRNPKPWNKLKSGRETFRRMFNWVQQPLHVRLSILDMYKDLSDSSTPGTNDIPLNTAAVMSPPTPAQNARQHSRSRPAADENGISAKRPRLVFTDIQKRTLQAIFKETQRPSREMQQTIAEHLRLDMSTVSNFFMNARRRSRNGSVVDDEPAPYQQVKPISPPPQSPTQVKPRSRGFKTSPESHSMPEHIDEAVAAVAHGASAGYGNLNNTYANLLEMENGNEGQWNEDAGAVDMKPGSSLDFDPSQYDDGSPQQHDPSQEEALRQHLEGGGVLGNDDIKTEVELKDGDSPSGSYHSN
uniref:One cut domain family member n=1 Tax=Panagrellus redivivus TaxID=6233 RepID=A0A7E4ZQ11_PANRE